MTRVPLESLILTRVPLGTLTSSVIYSYVTFLWGSPYIISFPTTFSRLIPDAFPTIGSLSKSGLWYKKHVSIYACCVTRTELLVGQAGKSSAWVMDIVWEELKTNNVDNDKDMLSFYISKYLDE